MEGGSTYRERFRQGATLVPRVLWVVEKAGGVAGSSASAPVVQSVRSNLEKSPWKNLLPLQGPIEVEFVRPVLFGTSIAPFRVMETAMAVVPWQRTLNMLLDASAAQNNGYPKLGAWLARAELAWKTHKSPATTMNLQEQLDYFGKLSAQFPIAPIRVLYSKAGTLPACAVLRGGDAVIDHKLYWAAATSESEALFLTAILNSETARSRVQGMQSRGQWGARDFDKVMFELPIAKFDPADALHNELALAAGQAEQAAAAVVFPAAAGFQAARRLIRTELAAQGISQHIDKLVEQLLGLP
jgi:hypothetical protein